MALRSMAQIQGSDVLALDGEIGRVVDTYFEDGRWIVRYLVVDTGNWLTGRKVLISPHSVKHIDDRLHSVSVDLTCERVRLSPDIDTDKPVSRQHEAEYFRYYGYPPYWYSWHSPTYWAAGVMPPTGNLTNPDRTELEERRIADERKRGEQPDSHLRSCKALLTYRVKGADDDDIGHVGDFLFNEATWAVRCLVINTGNWLSGRSVLVHADSIREVDWAVSVVKIGQSREEIVNRPPFDPKHLPEES
jgi:uncharacterized protein YrrD